MVADGASLGKEWGVLRRRTGGILRCTMAGRGGFWAVITSRIFLGVAVLALGAIGYGLGKSIVRRVEIEHEVASLQHDINQLQSKNDELQRLINYFSTPEYKEREARLRLGLQKPGENVVIIPGLEGSAGGEAAAQPVELPNWRRWFNYFFTR